MLQIRHILFPTDFSESSDQAFEHALFLAREHDATLEILHVIQLAPGYPHLGVPTMATMKETDVKKLIQEQIDRISDSGNVDLKTTIKEAPAIGRSIVEYSEEQDVDLIVIGTHGRQGVRRFFLGSEAEEVLRGAERPVLAVRKQDEPFPATPLRRVLVPVDLSERSIAALAHAQEIAAMYGAQLDVIHVVDPDLRHPSVYSELTGRQLETAFEIEAAVQETLKSMTDSARKAGIDVQTHVCHGSPTRYIFEFAQTHDMDLIVMSSHGRTGAERLLVGSVTQKVMRATPCPIFVVKSFGKMLVPDPKISSQPETAPES